MSTGRTDSHFRVSPKVLGPLGVEQLQDPALAVLELIKNSWDADATRVSISIDSDAASIVVSDNGQGMSQTDFQNKWLVIGASYKRDQSVSERGRSLIGEKGLGRLATFALGRSITIESSEKSNSGFKADIAWEKLAAAESIEDYPVTLRTLHRAKGTTVTVGDLQRSWTDSHTAFLVTHAEFLTAVPGEKFKIELTVDGNKQVVGSPIKHLKEFVETEIKVVIDDEGKPVVRSCRSGSVHLKRIQFRDFSERKLTPSLAGATIYLQFFRRPEATKHLKTIVEDTMVGTLLDRYQGVRIFRDGINVPPYGLSGNDWAALEKLRTQQGAKTMVPGNSQLIGEVHLAKKQHPDFVVTAGRSGFADQQQVQILAEYVRWAATQVGTARRAERLGIVNGEVPGTIRETESRTAATRKSAESAIADLSSSPEVTKSPALKKQVRDVAKQVQNALKESDSELRLYAQLASSGIAATSFSHELRGHFDVVSDAVGELADYGEDLVDADLIELLASSWERIRAFAGLFQVVPVRLRRKPKILKPRDIHASVEEILRLANSDRITTSVVAPKRDIRVVPAELDSILINLVTNSIKAIHSRSRKSGGLIRVSFPTRDSNLEICVADNGVGVTRKVEQIMFTPLEGAFSDGTGMGLPIVQYLASRYGGRVWTVKPKSEKYRTEMRVLLKGVAQ